MRFIDYCKKKIIFFILLPDVLSICKRWMIETLRVPMFDEVAVFVSNVSLSGTCHESAA